MDGTQMETRRTKRVFTPEQKFEILKDIGRAESVKAGLEKHGVAYSQYYKWSRQLQVGVNASLRNTKPIKAENTKRLEAENRRLKELVLNQSLIIGDLKKEMNLD